MNTFKIIVSGCMLVLASFSMVQAMTAVETKKDSIAPTVFLIGEYENDYNQLLFEYEILLLTACDLDMNVAYEKWMSMLREMEAYSEQVGYDLKGIKVWLNVFWDADGSVNHIAYYLRPISKNVDTQELSAFFDSFSKNYNFPLRYKQKYLHFGSAAFPLFPRTIGTSSKQNITTNN